MNFKRVILILSILGLYLGFLFFWTTKPDLSFHEANLMSLMSSGLIVSFGLLGVTTWDFINTHYKLSLCIESDKEEI